MNMILQVRIATKLKMVLTKLPGVTLATGLPAELVRKVEGRLGG